MQSGQDTYENCRKKSLLVAVLLKENVVDRFFAMMCSTVRNICSALFFFQKLETVFFVNCFGLLVLVASYFEQAIDTDN